jgi:hypothetical protein
VTRKLACAVLALSCFTACDGDVQHDAEGIWLLTKFDGIEVERGLTTTGTPWVEIAEVFEGNTGCNDFSAAAQDGAAPYRIEKDMLYPAEVFLNLVGCEPNDAEVALERVFGPEGIEITIQGDQMTWRGNGTRLEFIRAEERPPGS